MSSSSAGVMSISPVTISEPWMAAASPPIMTYSTPCLANTARIRSGRKSAIDGGHCRATGLDESRQSNDPTHALVRCEVEVALQRGQFGIVDWGHGNCEFEPARSNEGSNTFQSGFIGASFKASNVPLGGLASSRQLHLCKSGSEPGLAYERSR